MLPEEKTSVRVAVRVRPLSVREQADFSKPCLAVSRTEPQVIIGTEKAFTYDYTFDCDSQQEEIFIDTTSALVDGCFDGLNATVLAYGQTGSGKTYTMGTGFDVSIPNEELGIVPRAVKRIFDVMQTKHQESVEQQRKAPLFNILVQFVELYQDELIDLLDRASRNGRGGKRAKPPKLGEDKNGGVVLHNVCQKPVSSREEILDWLKQGALARTTGSTNMNAQSSRSHAIFTIEIKQTIQQNSDPSEPAQFLTTCAKFHFVDLAGSERLKRTNATGERQKEGISINSGLLALGNVISKLGDKSLKATHIPYRESKLTRLLQDSLGGNSRTVMIACVSPAQPDFVETLTTLRYANRARNIQNKVVSNQDTTGQTISTLRARILELEMHVSEFQQGKRQPAVEAYNDMFVENNALQKENENLRARLKQSTEAHSIVAAELADAKYRNAELRAENDRFREMSRQGEFGDGSDSMGSNQNLTDTDKMRIEYCAAVENLEAKLRKAMQELEQRDLSSSPLSPLRSSLSGSRTYRLPRKTFAVTPGSGDKMNVSGEDLQIPNMDNLSPIPALDLSDEDQMEVVSELDEKIREAEAEMEKIRNQMDSQKENYEAKIAQLKARITEVELEQSAHRKDSQSKKGADLEKLKERDVKYQKELEELRQKLKEAHELRTENKRLQKTRDENAEKLTKLQTEIAGMKRARCEAVRKCDQESKRIRQKELQQTRNLSAKDKELHALRKQLTDAKTMVVQLQHRVTRQQTELQIARKGVKVAAMSDLVAGRVGRTAALDEGTMRRNWEEFQKYFNAVAFKRMRLKALEKQLNDYNEELKNLRETTRKNEKSYSMAVEEKNLAKVDTWRSMLEDSRSTIHFLEQKVQEVQNEAAVCDESPDEYNNIDPIFIRLKFPEESSQQYFLAKLLDQCMSQKEELVRQEKRLESKSDELTILVKERNVLREILQFYVVESPNQTKIDIADVARKNLEENGVTDLSSEEVVKNILATPSPTPKSSSRTKARQLQLKGPEDLLGTDKSRSGSSSSYTTSTSSCTPSTSSGSLDGERSSLASDHMCSSPVEVSPATKAMPPPRVIPTNTILRDMKRTQESHMATSTPFVNGKYKPPFRPDDLSTITSSPGSSSSKGSNMTVTGFAIPTHPLRPPNRSSSLVEISEHPHKTTPSHGTSLENVVPAAAQSQFGGRVRRHACQSQLDKVPVASPARK